MQSRSGRVCLSATPRPFKNSGPAHQKTRDNEATDSFWPCNADQSCGGENWRAGGEWPGKARPVRQCKQQTKEILTSVGDGKKSRMKSSLGCLESPPKRNDKRRKEKIKSEMETWSRRQQADDGQSFSPIYIPSYSLAGLPFHSKGGRERSCLEPLAPTSHSLMTAPIGRNQGRRERRAGPVRRHLSTANPAADVSGPAVSAFQCHPANGPERQCDGISSVCTFAHSARFPPFQPLMSVVIWHSGGA